MNKGWKMNARGNLDWSMSGDDFNESLMDMASSGVNTFINSGLNGYGKGPSLGSYLLTKGVDMAKYGMMQSGWLGNSLRDKYAGASTFDLA
ncbi:MAG: hypothetical protein HPY53_13335, partial [Brevinematales bacterium]|nr:hypothetical protein [Brevinematales bacterium]